MARIGRFKLADAVTQFLGKVAGKKDGKLVPTHEAVGSV